MRLKILDSAEKDLEEGYRFYDSTSGNLPVSDLIFLIRFTLM
jgi:hypothetical protein